MTAVTDQGQELALALTDDGDTVALCDWEGFADDDTRALRLSITPDENAADSTQVSSALWTLLPRSPALSRMSLLVIFCCFERALRFSNVGISQWVSPCTTIVLPSSATRM